MNEALYDVSLMGRATLRRVRVEPSKLVAGGICVNGTDHYGPGAVYSVIPRPDCPPPPAINPYEGKALEVFVNGSCTFDAISEWRDATPSLALPPVIRLVLTDLRRHRVMDEERIREALSWLAEHEQVIPVGWELVEESDDIPF